MDNFDKIIFIGFNKTGTAGIHKVFKENQFKSIHGRPKGLCGSIAMKVEAVKNAEVVSDWCESHIDKSMLEELKTNFQMLYSS